MTDLTTTPTEALEAQDDGVLEIGIAAADTTIKVSPIKKWVNGIETTGGFDSTSGFCMIIDSAGRNEYISFNTASINSDNVTTLTDVRRGLSPTSATFTAGTGLDFDAGARIFIVDYPIIWQNLVTKDTAQTITGVKTIESGDPLQFGSSARYIKESGGDLLFNDDNNSETSLTTLTSAAGVNNKAKVSSNDTTEDFLVNQLPSGDGIRMTETGDGGDETLVPSLGNFTAASELTIATGAITATQNFHTIDTESDASGDDLATINGGTSGDMLFIRLAAAARKVCLKDGDGNLTIHGGDITLADLDTILAFFYDGDNWAMISGRDGVVGEMRIWTTDTAPTGWLLCDGSAPNASANPEYTNLFDAIGITFGGSDNTDFKVPDMRGRFPLGQDDMGGVSADRVTSTNADTVGSSDGSETKDISHSHTTTSSGNGAAGGGGGDIESVNTGGSTTQNVMNPYLTLNYIIKY